MVGIAVTGTIVHVHVHDPGQSRRALSLVPDLHVCVIRTDRIELNRVEGVHGPHTLRVVVG